MLTLQLRDEGKTQTWQTFPENGLLHETLLMQIDVLINTLIMNDLERIEDIDAPPRSESYHQ